MRLPAGTSTRSMRISVFCVLSILGGTSVAVDETASLVTGVSHSSSVPSSISLSPQAQRFRSLVNPNNHLLGGKRAYVYRSEYKRLPLYQFGLGKRWAPGIDAKKIPFTFGLGKRAREFSFGLGKRSSYENGDDRSLYNYASIPNEHYNGFLHKGVLDNYVEAKRTGGFNFGLGKRVAAGDERLPVKNLRDKYLFGLGKRVYVQKLEEEDEDEDEDEA